MRLSAYDFVEKPLDRTTLLNAIGDSGWSSKTSGYVNEC
jgi:FixJ family two-component response regulator